MLFNPTIACLLTCEKFEVLILKIINRNIKNVGCTLYASYNVCCDEYFVYKAACMLTKIAFTSVLECCNSIIQSSC